jgi:hypothetical protein
MIIMALKKQEKTNQNENTLFITIINDIMNLTYSFSFY